MASEPRPFAVRVFFPSDDPDHDYLGENIPFLAMPRPGEEIRIATKGEVWLVERAGHIEDDGYFVPAVWVRSS